MLSVLAELVTVEADVVDTDDAFVELDAEALDAVSFSCMQPAQHVHTCICLSPLLTKSKLLLHCGKQNIRPASTYITVYS